MNTGKSVFKEGTRYYAVDQESCTRPTPPAAHGPWRVTDKPPVEVDKIPPQESPYTAKYVKVYDSNEDNGHRSYTPATPVPT